MKTLAMTATGALLLLLPALINGYPLVFPDTGSYLRAVIEHIWPTDRPPYYGLLIFFVHLRISLWPIIVMQSLAVATALRFLVFAMIAGARSLDYFIVTAVLTTFTSVGWQAGQIMPDAFTGLLPILVFAIIWDWAGQGHWARVGLVTAVCGITLLHYSHFALNAGLFGVAALIRLSQGAGWSETRRIAAIGGAVSAIVIAAFSASSLVIVHQPVVDPDGSIFLAARVLADGPGRDWLATNCPGSRNPFCQYQNRISSDTAAFLWGASPLLDVERDLGMDQTRRAASQIVAGAITLRPRAQLAAALANSAIQLLRFETLATSCPQQCGEGHSIDTAMRLYFPREYSQFRNSLQMSGVLPVQPIRMLHSTVVYIAVIVALTLLYLACLNGDRSTSALILLVGATLVLNAILCGALSAPTDRYQSRVVWLLPLSALVCVARLWRSGKAGVRLRH